MGGIGFFVSVATRFDWLTLAAVWVGSRVLRDVYGARPGWRSKAVELLPPVHKLNEVSNSLITDADRARERHSLARRLRCALFCAGTVHSASRIVG